MKKEIRQLADIIYEEQGSNLVVIAARPLMGKTSLSLHLTLHYIVEKKATTYFSLKLSGSILKRYLLSISAGIEADKIKQDRLSSKDLDKMADTKNCLTGAPLTIHDEGAFSVEEIRLKAIEQKNRTGLDVLIIDYLQLLRSATKFDSRQEELIKILKDLKAIAEELAIYVIVLSQLNRSVEVKHDKRPDLNDLLAIGQVETIADKIIFLYSEAYYSNKPSEANSTEIIIAKNSSGKIGKIVIDNFLNL